MVYQTIDSAGDTSSNAHITTVMYPDTDNEESLVKNQLDQGLISTLTTLYNNTLLPGYEILYEDSRRPQKSSTSVDGDEYIDKFDDWLFDDNNGGDSAGANINPSRGIHLGIPAGIESAGVQHAADDCSELSFTNPLPGWTGVADKSTSAIARAQNGVVQETLHCHINYKFFEPGGQGAQLLPGTGPVDCRDHLKEHGLGKINQYHETTPMLTYHEAYDSQLNDCSGVGDCQSSYDWFDGYYSLTLTSCTITSVDDTIYHCCGQTLC